MQQKVIIYGGAFNPPTNAHLAIVKRLLKEAKLLGAELWLMPSGSRTDKTIDVERETRLAYVHALIGNMSDNKTHLRVETSELLRSAPTETIDTVQHLTSLYPGIHFVWVFGADSIQTMEQWREGRWLYDNLDMLVVKRHGYSLTALPPRSSIVRVHAPIVSSTQVREYLKLGKSVKTLVPHEVNQLLTATM